MEKTGVRLKIEQIRELDLWASNSAYTLLMMLPTWEWRFRVLDLLTEKLEVRRMWERSVHGHKI